MRNLWLFFLLGFVGCVKGYCVPWDHIDNVLNNDAVRCHNDFLSTSLNTVITVLGSLNCVMVGTPNITTKLTPKPGSSDKLQLAIALDVDLKVGNLAICKLNVNAQLDVEVTVTPGGIRFKLTKATSCTVALNGKDVTIISLALSTLTSALSTICLPVVNTICSKLIFGLEAHLATTFEIILINGQPYSCSVQNVAVGAAGLLVGLVAIVQGGTQTVVSELEAVMVTVGQVAHVATCTLSYSFIQYLITGVLVFGQVPWLPEHCLYFGLPTTTVLFLKFGYSQSPKCHFSQGSVLTVDLSLTATVMNGEQEIFTATLNGTLNASFQSSANCFGLNRVSFEVSLSAGSYDTCGCRIYSTYIEEIIKSKLKVALDAAKCGLGCLISVPSFPGQGSKPQTCGCNEVKQHVGCWQDAS